MVNANDYANYMVPFYAPEDFIVKKAKGSLVWDTNNKKYLTNAKHVGNWMLKSLENSDFLDNQFDKLFQHHTNYLSNNSAMTSGMTISFLIRLYSNGNTKKYQTKKIK
jgi:acetylornithine/succinyldiaminopimelate/putrescine aminotransferase